MKKSLLNYSLSLAIALTAGWIAPCYAEATESVAQTQHSATKGFQHLDKQIHKSPTDHAEYQAIRLDNGLEALLISDKNANKSLFAVGLPIGSMEDPHNQQGLAHYLEHMILMGSKAYPATNSLDAFLTQNGGRNNAYTAPDRTVYYLQVNHNAFDEAVARLSDAFSAPLLSETNAKKELNAVNAEMVRAKSSDGHLMLSVNRATSNPAHPVNNFSVGNNETLSDKPNSKLQDELLKFYQTYYSANIMKAVLYSNQPLDKLTSLATQTLGKIENRNIRVPTADMPLLRAEDNSVQIQYKPITPRKMLIISFDMPEDKADFKQKSGEYLAYMFNNSTDGTLADYLVKQGLADKLEAEHIDDVSRNRGSFSFYIDLTEKGLAEQDRVISLVFQQIEKIKQAGVEQHYFDELKESLSQDFQHLRTDKNFGYVADLVSQMLSYPLENVIDQPYVVEKMDKTAITAKLARMTPENVRIMYVNPEAKTDQTTPYFGAPYAIKKISDAQKADWLNFSGQPELELPEANPYFTTDFSLNKVDKTRQIPLAIVQEKGREIYTMPSRHFSEEAKAQIRVQFLTGLPKDELKVGIISSLLNTMSSLNRQKMDFQASVAGFNANILSDVDGISIYAGGYTQNLAQLLQDYLRHFNQFELTENTLKQAKERYLDSLDALEKANSARQALSAMHNFNTYPYYEPAHQRAVLAQITLSDLQEFRTRLLNESRAIRILSLGNFSDAQLKTLLNEFETEVKNQNSRIEFERYVDINQSQQKLNYIKSVPHEDNALSVAYYPRGYEELESNARAHLLNSIISSWYFDDLRTDKQLGYVAMSMRNTIGVTTGVLFTVQSPNASASTIMAHNQRFIAESFEKLKTMPAQEFEKYRHSLIEQLKHNPDSLEGEFADYYRDFMRGNAKFDTKNRTIARLQQITQDDIIEFYRKTLIEQEGMVFVSQALGTNADINQALELEGYKRVESLEELQKTVEIKRY